MVQGKPRSFYTKFKFIVEIDQVASAAFMSCSEIAMEVGVIEHREGGSLIPQKRPGLVSFDDIVLERGATDDEDLYNLFRRTADAAANAGLVDSELLLNMSIVPLDRDGARKKPWNVFDSFARRFVAAEFDNTAEENVIESVTIVPGYIARAA